jgi:hypothetical protein
MRFGMSKVSLFTSSIFMKWPSCPENSSEFRPNTPLAMRSWYQACGGINLLVPAIGNKERVPGPPLLHNPITPRLLNGATYTFPHPCRRNKVNKVGEADSRRPLLYCPIRRSAPCTYEAEDQRLASLERIRLSRTRLTTVLSLGAKRGTSSSHRHQFCSAGWQRLCAPGGTVAIRDFRLPEHGAESDIIATWQLGYTE